jgi:hypothetical protein
MLSGEVNAGWAAVASKGGDMVKARGLKGRELKE